MDFVAVLDQALTLLRQRGRVTYRTLQIQFALDDTQLAALKDELLYSQPQVVDDAGRGLVWTGNADPASSATLAPVETPGPPCAGRSGRLATLGMPWRPCARPRPSR